MKLWLFLHLIMHSFPSSLVSSVPRYGSRTVKSTAPTHLVVDHSDLTTYSDQCLLCCLPLQPLFRPRSNHDWWWWFCEERDCMIVC
eukprot:scaffold241_cov89-Cylindrotheca_fusiformis.AAC.16